MFIDRADIKVIAGNGGNGIVSWRREKFEPAGGPAGGDGGKGASVIIKSDNNIHTLMDFRYKKVYKGENGENGKTSNMFGKDGEDIILKVPVGTLVKDQKTGGVIVDLNENNQEFVIAEGGRGGRGNTKFRSSTRRAPNFSEDGKPGETREITLELKLLADVGLIGYPNVGKSTLLSIVSAAKPKIENYHFTTLSPNLGVVNLGFEKSFVIADIPGLIEGAAEGVGLGHDFLKHIERTRVLIHVLDISGIEGRDPLEDFDQINKELQEYNPKLKDKPQIVYANKMDLPGAEENLERLKEKLKDNNIPIFSGSIANTDNLDQLMSLSYQIVQETNMPQTYDEEYVPVEKKIIPITVDKVDGEFVIYGDQVEELLRKININDNDSLRYLQTQLSNMGIMDMLQDRGVSAGDTVIMGEIEFEYML